MHVNRVGLRWFRWTILVSAALVGVLALIGSGAARGSESRIEAFYRPLTAVPRQPGQLVRSAPYVDGIPDTARGWRILYTTTRANGSAAIASAVVVASRAPSARPEPVVVWAHGTTGYARDCAPSLAGSPFEGGIGRDAEQVLRHHWIYVAPDYTGLGTPGPQPYLIGRGEARAVLDAVRATRHLPELSVANRVVVWGHSQGGGAALWTAQIRRTYAPDVRIVGVAAIAPTSNMPVFVQHLNTTSSGRDLMAYVIASYAAAYRDVKAADYLKPAAVPVVRQIVRRCGKTTHLVLLAPGISPSLRTSLLDRSPNTGPFGTRLRQNTPTSTGGVPLLLAQGEADRTVPPAMQRAYARMLCATGTRLDYRQYPGRSHSGVESLGAPLIPELMTWTEHRLAGDAFAGSCPLLGARRT